MNAGLSSLTKLKQQLLAEALRASTKYDAALSAIGLGVAAQFEKYCNRKFARVAADTFTCSADRDHVFLPRYPVEDVTEIALKTDETTGFEVQSNVVISREDSNGMVYWGAFLGPFYGRIRITFTGGYWWDSTEEGNDTLPTGATAVPDDLYLAWVLQCRVVWQAIDKLGKDIVTTGSSSQFGTGTLAGLELNAQVKAVLDQYRRFQMT
jgi:hypothetical protein